MRINGADLNVEDTGGAGPAIVFSHGLLWSTAMWRFQVEAFRGRHRCIAYDHRGQGRSEVTGSGYDMDSSAPGHGLATGLLVAPVMLALMAGALVVGVRRRRQGPRRADPNAASSKTTS